MNAPDMPAPTHPTEIHQPRAYFAAQVRFAVRISETAPMPLLAAIDHYTGLYREVTGRNGLEGGIDPLWPPLAAQVATLAAPEAITDLLYATYLAQPHSLYRPHANTLHATVIGALGYVYDAKVRQARLHFFPQRSSESALATKHFASRRADFRNLLLDVRANHPDAATVKSSTWLQNLPNYRNLFPAAFQARLQNIRGSTYLGVWGQFVKGNGHGNEERLAMFTRGLAEAHTIDAAIDVIPLPVLEATGPLDEFYAEYGI